MPPSSQLVRRLVQSFWTCFYIVALCAVVVGAVIVPQLSWLCNIAFVTSLASLVFHVVRASLTRNVMPLRLILGLNVVVIAASALVRHKLSTLTASSIVVAVPMVSYFCFVGWQLALAPPRPGEALRDEKRFGQCHWSTKLIVTLVLTVEFIQFNALSFNPALGTWGDLRQLSSYFSYSFFVFASSEYDFEHQLYLYCTLALGWVLFAAVTLTLIARQRRAGLPNRARAATPSRNPSSQSEMSDEVVSGEASVNESEHTMPPPLKLVFRMIIGSALAALRLYGTLLRRCQSGVSALVYGASKLGPCVGKLVLLPLAPILLFGLLAVLLLTGFVCWLILGYVFMGLAICAAFASIALLHFPILMNMLSVLNCEYDELGHAGNMTRMPSQPCWEGEHWLFASASVVTLALLYPVMIHFERKRQSAAEVSYHVRFTACMLIGKLALSACSAILISAIPPASYLLLCAAMLVAFLHVNNQREQDAQPACCNVRSVRLLRSMLLTCAIWSTMVTLASTVLVAPDWVMALTLGVLWLLTALYFGLIILLPQHEPSYRACETKIELMSVVFQSPRPAPLSPFRGGSNNSMASTPVEQYQPTPHPLPTSIGCPHLHQHHQPQPQPQPQPPQEIHAGLGPSGGEDHKQGARYRGQGTRPPGGEDHTQTGSTSTPAGHRATPGYEGGGDEGGGGQGGAHGAGGFHMRTVWLPAALSARPRVTLYEYDHGFDVAETPHSDALAAAAGGAPDGSRPAATMLPPPHQVIPIVLTTQPSVSGGLPAPLLGGSGAPADGKGAGYRRRMQADSELRPGDVIVGVNGRQALSAKEVADLIDKDGSAALTLTVQQASVRADGTKRSRAAQTLADYPVRYVAQCLMMHPQDGELQRAGCERLLRAAIDASQRSTLPTLIEEVRRSYTLPVVINAMEVHVAHPGVLTAAARLLCCLANAEGHLRANVIAAGVLPALCEGLREHDGHQGCMYALCDLVAEICSARGAPPGSRRAMCEAVAATHAHRALLRALRANIEHEGIVAAGCKVPTPNPRPNPDPGAARLPAGSISPPHTSHLTPHTRCCSPSSKSLWRMTCRCPS